MPGSSILPRASAPKRIGIQGMTLIEVMIAMGIFAVTIVSAMSTLASTIRANRITSANIVANGAILAKVEEVQMVAHTSYNHDDSIGLPEAVIKFYGTKVAAMGSTAGDNGVLVGPNGTAVPKVQWATRDKVAGLPGTGGGEVGILHTFPVQGLMELVSATDDATAVYDKGYGQMVIYLDEAAVPSGGADTIMWTDLGANSHTEVINQNGFDMNADEVVTNGGVMINGERKTPRQILDSSANAKKIVSLPIDIMVRYYKDREQTRPYYETTRRLMITGVGDLAKLKAAFGVQ